MGLSAFLSYSRADEALAVSIARDLTDAGVEVWRDERLSGGQSWWNAILAAIREADVLVLVLSARSLDSEPCTRERAYAEALGKSVLPVRVDGTSPRVAPPSLASQEWTDYRPDDRTSVVHLLRAVYSLPPAPPLPTPLPDPPAVPLSYVNDLSALVHRSEELSAAEQHSVIFQLREGLRDPEEREQCVQLLERLRLRRDLLASVSREIDEVLPASRGAAAPAPAGARSTGPAPLPEARSAPSGPPPPAPTPVGPGLAAPWAAGPAPGPSARPPAPWAPGPPAGASRPQGYGPWGPAPRPERRRRRLWWIAAAVVGVLAVVAVVVLVVLDADPPYDYGDDDRLDALWDQCAVGDLASCDQLFVESAVESLYEEFAFTCGYRTGGPVEGGCVTLPFPYTYGDDGGGPLDILFDQCVAGDMAACDTLYTRSPEGSDYQLTASLCGGTVADEQSGQCAAIG